METYSHCKWTVRGTGHLVDVLRDCNTGTPCFKYKCVACTHTFLLSFLLLHICP